uniref:Uncharacterized protein n=1 Tax=Fagus sylvatica TaxID=28930 RepID=A0A2N9GZY2_FAGSY
MTKEFAVPPVVFPSGANPVAGTGAQQRRVPTAPFQPQRPSSSSIPFMSFEIGSAAASTSSASIYGGPIGGGGGSVSGGANFEDEEPLLDELGIHPGTNLEENKVDPQPVPGQPDRSQGLGPIWSDPPLHVTLPLPITRRFAIAGFFVFWATRVCTALMVALADGGDEHRGLIAYACFLIYTLFSLLVIF